MNNLIRTGLTAAAAFMSVGILFNSALYAANNQRPEGKCQPNCDTADVPTEVNLSWTAPTTRTDGEPLSLSELEGYRIYYGTDNDNLIPLVDLDDSSLTSYSITDLSPGVYFFTVTAYDYEGLESGYSEVVSKETL